MRHKPPVFNASHEQSPLEVSQAGPRRAILRSCPGIARSSLEPEDAPFIYDRCGNATSVVLDAGRVVGVWDLGKSDDPLSVKVAPLGRWPKRRWDAVGAEVERIGKDAAVVEGEDRATQSARAPRQGQAEQVSVTVEWGVRHEA